MNDNIRILPARELVASRIRNKIFLGELKPGERLKQEDLANELGVSRMPIREAIKQLVSEGFVDAIPNKSAIVSNLSSNFIQDFFDVRILLECRAIELAINDVSIVNTLSKINEEYQEAFKKDNLERINALNFQFHISIWNSSNNFKLRSLLLNLWNGLPSNKEILDLSCTIVEHNKIIEAFRQKDSELAKKSIEEHLLKSMNRYLELSKKY